MENKLECQCDSVNVTSYTMFRNTYQKGFLTVFSSSGSKPLEIWDLVTKNGHAKRVTDEELKLLSFELMGANVATTYMVAPKCPCPSLGVKLPFLVLLVKNLKKFFSFEIQILDDRNMLRRFRASNYQSSTRVDNFCTVMPLALTPGWNQIQFNLADFTRRAYGTNYIETVRIQIHANVRVKRVYFSDRLYPDDELPAALRLHPPLRPCKITNRKMMSKSALMVPVETIRPPSPEKEPEGIAVATPVVNGNGRRNSMVPSVGTAGNGPVNGAPGPSAQRLSQEVSEIAAAAAEPEPEAQTPEIPELEDVEPETPTSEIPPPETPVPETPAPETTSAETPAPETEPPEIPASEEPAPEIVSLD